MVNPIEQNQIYELNPSYMIKPDKNRVFITNRGDAPRVSDFIGFIHPIYAILLTLFDGQSALTDVIATAAAYLKKDPAIITQIISPLLENKEELHFHYSGYHLSLPVQVLVKKNDNLVYKRPNFDELLIPQKDLDMTTWRFNTPLNALFMINTRCVTDCVYCYADRRQNMDCQIPFSRLKELIQEAKSLHMRSFEITGGEFFLYKHWEELLSELLDNGFPPYISTKTPLTSETIKKLKTIGLKKIQISIDSVRPDELMTILRVPANYPEKLMQTINELDANDFEIFTNSQITVYNYQSINELLDFLLSLKNIKRINIGPAAFSLYRGLAEFEQYKMPLSAVEPIRQKIENLKTQYVESISINFTGYNERSAFFDKSMADRKKDFDARARCSGNFYGFVILPDGKVTVCEELYWHPRFIIGDLTRQSIAEVWNSPQALELYHISQDMVRASSECKTCNDFEVCHRNKGVCWKEILYAYNFENWDYPDPKCPIARVPERAFYLS